MGWEPTETTEVLDRDDEGRPTKWVTRREPEWDGQQRELMLAYLRYKDLVCHGCGGWLPETTQRDEEEYDVDSPWRCGQCTALMKARERYAKDRDHVEATRWQATVKPEHQHKYHQ